MNDDHSLDMAPRAEFCDRLEADLLRVMGHRTYTLPITEPEETFVIVEPRTVLPSRRRRWMAPAAAAIIALGAVGVIAWARRDEPTVVEPADAVPVSFTIHWAYSDVQRDCPTDVSATMCMNHFDFPTSSQLKGDVAGYGYQGVFWNAPADYSGQTVDHLEHVGAYNIKATIAGCGTGEFMLMEMMQFKSGAEHDRPSGTYIGTWEIVPESGRDGLVSITGSGTSHGVFGTAQADGRTFTGTIACPEVAG
jgi:hypothetical protein